MSRVLLMPFQGFLGNEYLKRFLRDSVEINCVIIQGSSVNKKEKYLLNERTMGRYKQPIFEEVISEYRNLDVIHVKSHNSNESHKILLSLKPEIIYLATANIISPKILNTAKLGVLNSHPGILPYYQGCSCVEWSILNNDPVGATCHLAIEKVDSGGIIYKEEMDVLKVDDYYDIRINMIYHVAKVMAKGAKMFLNKNLTITNQPKSIGKYHRPIKDEDLSKVIQIINNNDYKHAL